MADHVRGPLPTGSLRELGAFLHVFAIESFMDELAEHAGRDPLEFRLAHLGDPRARTVLKAAAEAARWEPRVGPSGRGQGLALPRYACDAGVVVNPEGLRQQVEGGIVHGIGRTFHEALRVDSRGAHSRSWASYPVARFHDVPAIDVVLLNRPGLPPIGAGESATPPTAPAIANAIDDAIGIRMRDLPINPHRMRERLIAMGPDDSARLLR